jgi:predicted transcriptional regulator
MDGSKTIEIRRRFSKTWKGQRAVFYASEPTGALLGQAHIADVHKGSPQEIWHRFSKSIGCEFDYYDSYVKGCDNVYAIELADVSPLREPIYSSTLCRYTSRRLASPQSYVALTDKQGWSEAVSISVMLQCLLKDMQLPPRREPLALQGDFSWETAACDAYSSTHYAPANMSFPSEPEVV